jgi:predicted DNA-binding transcriptional regulator AlpA
MFCGCIDVLRTNAHFVSLTSSAHPTAIRSQSKSHPERIAGMHAINRALSIEEWCEKWRFCRAYYYVLKKRGNAPREMRIGRAVRITPEADAEWAKAQETAAA